MIWDKAYTAETVTEEGLTDELQLGLNIPNAMQGHTLNQLAFFFTGWWPVWGDVPPRSPAP